MRHARTLFTLLFLTGTMFSAGFVSMAQTPVGDETTFVMPESGVVVDVGDSGEAMIDAESYLVSDFGSYMQEDFFVYVGQSFIGVTVAWGDVDPELWNQDSFEGLAPYYLSNAEILGHEETAESSWFLLRGNQSLDYVETLYGDFHMNDETDYHFSVGVFAEDSALVDTMIWAQNNLTMDGEPVFADVDVAEVEAMLAGTSEFEPIPLVASGDIDFGFEALGLISDTEWQIPSNDVTVTWDAAMWEFPSGYAFALTQTGENQYWIRLVSVDLDAEIEVATTDNLEDYTSADWEARWNDPDWLASGGMETSTLASSSDKSHVSVITQSADGGDLIMIREAMVREDGSIVMISIIARPGDAVQAYGNFADGLMVDGASWQLTWTVEEIEEILGE